jgi:predicted RNase H-like nuclease (RuvC/YqgF family)
MKTRKEIDHLKASWTHDPCWDLADTEGFEDHREELSDYQEKMEAYWKEQREGEKRDSAHRMGLVHPSKLAEYISGVEWRIDQLILRIDEVEKRNEDLQRRLDYLDRTTRSLI